MFSCSPTLYSLQYWPTFGCDLLCALSQLLLYVTDMRLMSVCLALACVTYVSAVSDSCDPAELVQYKVTFQGLWTKARFPKVYPGSRPKAEWSSLIGRSHSSDYKLFSFGELVNSRLQSFVEEGDLTSLDGEGQGHSHILDAFTSQAIPYGYGSAEAQFFSDSSRSKVSFAVKIVPSPDWFVGVDSYSLCQHGVWINAVQFDLRPLDAGTRRGYTFSSPKWRSDPQEEIHEITSQYPNHTADAFYYPHLTELPPIAKVSISRLQAYRVVADRALKVTTAGPVTSADVPIHNPHNAHGTKMIKPPVPHFTRSTTPTPPQPSTPSPPDTSTAATQGKSITETSTSTALKPTLNAKILAILNRIQNRKDQLLSTQPATTTMKSASVRSTTEEPSWWSTWLSSTVVSKILRITPAPFIFDDEDTNDIAIEGSGAEVEAPQPTPPTTAHTTQGRTTPSTTANFQSNKILPLDDVYDPLHERVCLVSSWTEWSECSRTCGYGMKTRTRQVTKWTENVVCPELKMEQLCGSMKKCNWNHFSLKFNSSKSIFGNQKRIRQKKIKGGSIGNSTGALRGQSSSFRRRYRISTTPKTN